MLVIQKQENILPLVAVEWVYLLLVEMVLMALLRSLTAKQRMVAVVVVVAAVNQALVENYKFGAELADRMVEAVEAVIAASILMEAELAHREQCV
jgi:hypothetical protein